LDDILTQGEHESLAKSSIDVYISFIVNFQGRELQLITIKLFFEICSVQPLSQTEL
ncbi:5422_t:CDS:2, partial [Entrophospora sp. SA101]